MRLVCSNCGAQYEVDDSVIPDNGRDVQCSNCGHAWFQPGRYQPAAEVEVPEPGDWTEEAADPGAATDLDAPDPGPAGTRVTAVDPARPVAGVGQTTGEAAGEASGQGGAGADGTASGTGDVSEAPSTGAAIQTAHPSGPRRALDETMLSVLREEAEREARARREEGTADLEVQPDLGLSEGSWAPAAPPEETVDLRQAAHDADAAGGARGRGRGLLPDIEEINSTLRAAPGRGTDDTDPHAQEVIARRRGDFRLGFSISLIVAVLLLALYVLAPSLAVQVPALAPALSAYVSAVNEARLWIDEMMRSSTEAMRGTAAGG
ncbi:MAG: zinc-ribbon domain-containing protein [Pseudomonadota bacterium]